MSIPSFPLIKPKGFLNAVAPIVHKGIPAFADSVRDPKVIGTPAHTEFWEDELYKILNGVQIGSVFVPGRFYYYLNYKHMQTINGVITPDMVDLHLELCYYYEHCKANGKNLLSAKGRRKGISEAAHTMIVDYGARFGYAYKAGVAAGNKTYVEDFLSKWRFADSRLPPELSAKKLVDNDDEIVFGYQQKSANGNFEEQGTFNTIYARTMHNNPNMFKGLYLNDIVSEEIGEHENWIEFFGASKDCLRSGNKQVGVLTGFGTGGNVNKGSKDFKKVWADYEIYNFVRFMIPAQRFYYYGGASESNRRLSVESELFKKYKPYELIGCEDTVLAEKDILKNREKLLRQGNLKEYNEDLQNNPINETEIFRKTVVNNFNVNKLNEQDIRITALTHPRWSKYKLEWDKDDKGMIKMPLSVSCKPLQNHEDQNECVWIIDGEHPRKNFTNLYVSGVDSYDQDVAKASKSLGAMCVMIRANIIQGAMQKVPVAVISCRPKRKELFYDLCLKLAVYYNLVGNVLVDVGAGVIMNYFNENGCWRFLADRPRKFESENSEQTHEKGVRLTNFSRPRMTGLMQAHIEDYVHEIWFPELINQLGNYDEIEVGSDNDLADAYGIALMQDISCEIKPRDEMDNSVDDRYTIRQYVTGPNGTLIPKIPGSGSVNNPELDSETFGLLFGGKSK